MRRQIIHLFHGLVHFFYRLLISLFPLNLIAPCRLKDDLTLLVIAMQAS